MQKKTNQIYIFLEISTRASLQFLWRNTLGVPLRISCRISRSFAQEYLFTFSRNFQRDFFPRIPVNTFLGISAMVTWQILFQIQVWKVNVQQMSPKILPRICRRSYFSDFSNIFLKNLFQWPTLQHKFTNDNHRIPEEFSEDLPKNF